MIRYFFSSTTLVVLLCGSLIQCEVTFNGDNNLVFKVNETSNFDVKIYRNLQPVTTPAPTPTPGIPTSQPSSTTVSSSTLKTTPSTPTHTGSITVSVVAIKEADSNSKPLTVNGYSLSKEELMTRSYAVGSSYQTYLNTESTVQALCYQFNTNAVQGVTPKGALNITVCSVHNNGTITSTPTDPNNKATEAAQTTMGEVWIGVTVSNWNWCTNCALTGPNNVTGAFLNVDVEVTVDQDRKISKANDAQGKPTRYSLGEDSYLDLSTMVRADTNVTTMPSNFPSFQLTQDNWKGVLTFSLARFQISGTFWFLAEPGYKPASKDGGGVVGGASQISAVSSTLIGSLLICIISAVISV